MRLLLSLLREIPKWDKSSQIALVIAFLLLIADLLILATVPNLQTQALIGAVGLLLAIQAIFMWGNRNLVAPYTQAQRLFIEGDFEGAVNVLTSYIENEAHPVIDALVLLGNAHRNLGQLDKSETVLRIALARRRDYHFALYGIGKIRMAKGDYGEAIMHFEKAIASGAPDVVNFDLAHTYYRMGNKDESLTMFEHLSSLEIPYRVLFRDYVLQQTPSQKIVQSGIAFWEAEIERFADTPYGQALIHDVQVMKNL